MQIHSGPPPSSGVDAVSDRHALDRLDVLARLLDSRWRVPGLGIRFGADALMSLVPGLGPAASTVVSAYLIWEARRLGVSTGTLLRMIGNVGLDSLISAVPLAGTVGDVFFRANLRNMALLRKHVAARGGGSG
ncbi:DUF4112 domain-containing protein [Teichococcus oryzae]|uniref:DUF4112 domain-containing protein n=1 Tax=Teichococcus oryzae TaxID=1608942 RepID=A0A5B2TG05_9PROT|nr:DUF4112 domain-containing protein [Pseudoroseomonas oryzae]KAA2212925.1 DUF4112 domain-containing protein [Pseudoroseomonas oryzae]